MRMANQRRFHLKKSDVGNVMSFKKVDYLLAARGLVKTLGGG